MDKSKTIPNCCNNFKTDVDWVVITNLQPSCLDFDVADNDVFKKTLFEKYSEAYQSNAVWYWQTENRKKILKCWKKNKLNSSWLVEKTNYNTKIVETRIEMYDASGLVSKYGFNSRLKILDIKYMMLGEWSKRLITNKNRRSWKLNAYWLDKKGQNLTQK